MTGPEDTPRTPRPMDQETDGTPITAPATPVAHERTDGPMDSAEFAERLDMNPEVDDVKG